MPRQLLAFTASALLLALTACAQKTEAAKTAESPVRVIATIQDIMAAEVDPAADAIWASVASVSDASGSQDHQPRTDEEWKAVRHNAITLVEAANLLVLEGRRVAVEGNKLEDAHVVGILSPHEIQEKIDGDRASFIKRAHALQDAAKEALVAIDAKDAARLFAVGDKLDHACEQCHVQYWYPNDTRPPAPPFPRLEPKKS
jgi:hypothetical protein